MLKTFRALKAASDYRRRRLPFLETLVDQDLIREIGYHQAIGHPITLKQLYMHGISSVATIHRRLARLKRLGVVEQARATHDKRIVRLTLTKAALRLHEGWLRTVRTSRS